MSVVEQGGVTFVRDDTKAPRWSLDAAFEFLAEARADHLSRVALNRVSEVRCWRASCGRASFCEDCPLLYGRFAPPV